MPFELFRNYFKFLHLLRKSKGMPTRNAPSAAPDPPTGMRVTMSFCDAHSFTVCFNLLGRIESLRYKVPHLVCL